MIENSNHSEYPVLGIDVSKKKFDVALPRDEKYKTKSFGNDAKGFKALEEWLHRLGADRVHACMESTNTYGERLAEFLHDAGSVVSVVNPARIKGFAKSELSRTKTDKTDAKPIARFCRAMKPTPWTPDPLEIRQLRSLSRRLDALVEMRQQEVNRLDVASEVLQPGLKEHIGQLDNAIKQTKDLIKDHIDNHPALRHKKMLLESIPGIGEVTIALILSEFGNIRRFKSAKHLASFIGLAPREIQSGTSVRSRAKMSKTGSTSLRKAFFMPALVALRYNPVLIELKARLTAAGKSKMLIVGAAMRKLVHIIFGVLKNDTPFDAHFAR
jgi:transposase